MVGGKIESVAAFPLVVGDPFFYRKQVPLIVSEWGGFGFLGLRWSKEGNERTELIADLKKN